MIACLSGADRDGQLDQVDQIRPKESAVLDGI